MEYETYADVIDAYNADNMGYSTLTDYIKGQNIKIKEIEMDPIGDMQKIFENKADGGMIGIEVLFRDKKADGGRVPMVSGGALKGLMSLFKGGDKAADLAKQEEIFRTGPITTKFLEDVDDKLITKFVRTRDTKGPGSYGMYDSFDDMPAGLKAAELISRIRKKGGGIDYEKAEFFLGTKLKGNESIDELIDIMLTKGSIKSDFAKGGRVGLFMGGDPLTGQALNIYNSMNAYGFSDQEIADALSARGLYTPGGSTPPETTQPNIIGAQLNQGGGGGGSFPIGQISDTSTGFAGTGLIGDFMAANEARNRKLVQPGKIAQFAYDRGFPKQRSVQEMIESGRIDTRRSAGMPFGISGLIAGALPDRYFDMSLGDQVFTQSQMGYDGPTVFGENTMGNKDPFGINVRSAFGNYAEYVTNRVADLEESLKNAQKKYGGLTDQYFNMTKNLRRELDFRKAQEQLKQDQARRIEEERQNRIAAERAAGAAANQAMQRQAGGGGGGNLTRSRAQGGLGLSASQAQAVSAANAAAGMGGFGLKDGGLATMFTRRR